MRFAEGIESKQIAYLIIAIFAVSSSAILVRLSHTPSITIAFYRQLFSAVFLLPFFLQRSDSPLSGSAFVLLLLSGLFLALHFATWITALSYTTVARATLFVDLQPIWASLLGLWLLKERLTRLDIAGVVLVTAGGVISAGFGLTGGRLLGDFLALVGGITGAAYFLIGRKLRAEVSWSSYMFCVNAISAGWLLALHFGIYHRFPLPNSGDVRWILLMALFPSLIGHGLFNLVIRRTKAYVVNSAFLAEPLLATLLAFWIFGEQPDVFYFIGAPVVLVGLSLILFHGRFVQRGTLLQ